MDSSLFENSPFLNALDQYNYDLGIVFSVPKPDYSVCMRINEDIAFTCSASVSQVSIQPFSFGNTDEYRYVEPDVICFYADEEPKFIEKKWSVKNSSDLIGIAFLIKGGMVRTKRRYVATTSLRVCPDTVLSYNKPGEKNSTNIDGHFGIRVKGGAFQPIIKNQSGVFLCSI